MNDFERFQKLIESGYGCISIVTHEERYALEIIRKTALELDRDMWVWSMAGGVYDGHLAGAPFIEETETPVGGLKNLTAARMGSLCVIMDMAEHLKAGGKALRLLREVIANTHQNGLTLILVDHQDRLPDIVKTNSVSFDLSYPDERELQEIVKATLLTLKSKRDIAIEITPEGLAAIVRNLRGLTRRQAARIIRDAVLDNHRFSDEDINTVLASKRRMVQQGGLLEYIQTPLDLSEIGGMRNLKSWLNARLDIFSKEARSFGIEAPKGVLMLGVQGAGKSLCAKAIATAWRQPLLRLDPGTLYASYIGQSEANLREALKQTEMMAPVILWIDEIEKAFASAASRSADGGLSQRLFGTLLTWLQEHEELVFVVATANDIEALPPELLRKGRFDEIFFVDLPNPKIREEIFGIHLKKRERDPATFDLAALAKATDGYSGAEIEQGILSALHEAFAAREELTTEQLITTLQKSPPLSVSMAERVSAARQWAVGRCVPADEESTDG